MAAHIVSIITLVFDSIRILIIFMSVSFSGFTNVNRVLCEDRDGSITISSNVDFFDGFFIYGIASGLTVGFVMSGNVELKSGVNTKSTTGVAASAVEHCDAGWAEEGDARSRSKSEVQVCGISSVGSNALLSGTVLDLVASGISSQSWKV